jgi:cation:H+ antiporter
VAYIHLFGGLIYLLLGGDLLVRGAVALARRARVAPIAIALSVVALGTSLPELVVTLEAVIGGYQGIAIGNVVGSNIANVLLVIGLAAVVFPLPSGERTARRDSLVMIGVSAVFVALCFVGYLGLLAGVVLLSGLVVLVLFNVRRAALAQRAADRGAPLDWVLGLPSKTGMIALFITLGMIGLPLGATMLIRAAVEVAEQLQVSDAVIGLTVIAVGTSLPELATSAVAAFQRQAGVAVGAVIGSNTFNVLVIMGLATAASPSPIDVPPGFLSLDLPVMLGSSIVLALLVWRGRPIGRWVGAIFLTAYAAYLFVLISTAT